MLSVYIENLIVTISVLVLLSWGFYLPLRAGQLFNGPVYSATLGGYFAAYVSKVLGWPVPIGFMGGIMFSGLFAFAFSFILAPLNKFQMGMITIALILISQTIFRNLDFVGGVTGMGGVPGTSHLLLICFLSILICLVMINRLSKSRWGRAMELAEADGMAASAMGVDTIKMSVVLQTISGAMGGLAGVIYIYNIGAIHPEIFGVGQLLYCFTIVIVGGRTTPWGILISAPILWLMPEFFPSAIAEFRNIIYGAIIIIFLLSMPKGIITKSVVTNVERLLEKIFSTKGLYHT